MHDNISTDSIDYQHYLRHFTLIWASSLNKVCMHDNRITEAKYSWMTPDANISQNSVAERRIDMVMRLNSSLLST